MRAFSTHLNSLYPFHLHEYEANSGLQTCLKHTCRACCIWLHIYWE